jgi:hypothetical protein
VNQLLDVLVRRQRLSEQAARVVGNEFLHNYDRFIKAFFRKYPEYTRVEPPAEVLHNAIITAMLNIYEDLKAEQARSLGPSYVGGGANYVSPLVQEGVRDPRWYDQLVSPGVSSVKPYEPPASAVKAVSHQPQAVIAQATPVQVAEEELVFITDDENTPYLIKNLLLKGGATMSSVKQGFIKDFKNSAISVNTQDGKTVKVISSPISLLGAIISHPQDALHCLEALLSKSDFTAPFIKVVEYVTSDLLHIPQELVTKMLLRVEETYNRFSEQSSDLSNSDSLDLVYRFNIIKHTLAEISELYPAEFAKPFLGYILDQVRNIATKYFHHRQMQIVLIRIEKFSDLEALFTGADGLDEVANDLERYRVDGKPTPYEKGLDRILRTIENIMIPEIDDHGPIYCDESMLSTYVNSNKAFCMFRNDDRIWTNKDYYSAPEAVKQQIMNRMKEITLFCRRVSVIMVNPKFTQAVVYKPIPLNERNYLAIDEPMDRVVAHVLSEFSKNHNDYVDHPDCMLLVDNGRVLDTYEMGYSLDSSSISLTRGSVWFNKPK